MLKGKSIPSRAIRLANADHIEALYERRQVYLNNLAILKRQEASFGSLYVPPYIVTQITEQEDAIGNIETELRNMGLPVDPIDLLGVFSSVKSAIKTLRDAQEIADWVRSNFPKRYRAKTVILDSSERAINPKLTGKWFGTWRSRDEATQSGDATMAICQIEDIIIGSGALRAYPET